MPVTAVCCVPVAWFTEPVLYLEVFQGCQGFSQGHRYFMFSGILEIKTRENVFSVFVLFFFFFLSKKAYNETSNPVEIMHLENHQ